MKKVTNILITVIVLIVVIGGGLLLYKKTNVFGNNPGGNYSNYYAVALTTNELFFGKLTSENTEKVVLEDVYFFTYVQDQTSAEAKAANPSASPSMHPTLIDTSTKDSIAPTNTYVINRQQVKYMYPLKDGSQVLKTIDEYKTKQK